MKYVCECEDWERYGNRLLMPLYDEELNERHKYPIKTFLYCPWCGDPLRPCPSF